MKFGFVRVAAAVPKLKVADCEYNVDNMLGMIEKADGLGVQYVVFPELSITAYTCGDLFHQHALLKEAELQLARMLERTREFETVVVAGMPLCVDNQLFNCAVVFQKGKLLGAVPKTYIPGYSEFYEERWFSTGSKVVTDEVRLCGQVVPFGIHLLFQDREESSNCFGVEICEDSWVPIPPSSYQAMAGASLLFNLSASNEVIGKYNYRKEMVRQQSGRCFAAYIYTSCGIYESTTDLVFGGHALIAENGSILTESQRFSQEEQLLFTEIDLEKLQNNRFKNTSFMEGLEGKKFKHVYFEAVTKDFGDISRFMEPHPFVPKDESVLDERCQEIFAIQTSGLGKRLRHTKMKKAVIGISGGLDSTLALLVTARAFDELGIPRTQIQAITMPGFGTTNETYSNALSLMKSMGVTIREIDIRPACLQHFNDIGHDASVHDVTYENVQARERTQILMDIANREGGLVIGTGDLSELALGWCTYNGDHMSMYAVNCSIPKTLVKFLVQWVAGHVVEKETCEVLLRIIETPISPELLPPDATGGINQKTEELIGPYELHDFFLYHMMRFGTTPGKILYMAELAFTGVYDNATIKHWLKMFYRRFFSQQFKRSCLPDGPKVGTVSLSPRGDWRMPSDAEATLWLKELE